MRLVSRDAFFFWLSRRRLRLVRGVGKGACSSGRAVWPRMLSLKDAENISAFLQRCAALTPVFRFGYEPQPRATSLTYDFCEMEVCGV